MKKLLFLLVFLSGCAEDVSLKDALVNITCYDKNGSITLLKTEYKGSMTIVDDPNKIVKTDKCIIQRVK